MIYEHLAHDLLCIMILMILNQTHSQKKFVEPFQPDMLTYTCVYAEA